MGNKLCACDEAMSEATITPMGIARPTVMAIQRDDSRAKLMVPVDAKKSSPKRATGDGLEATPRT